MSPLLDLQRRFRELGRIRLGQKQQTRSGKMAPAKLYTFRLTSPSEMLIRSAADVFGGTAQPWQNGDRNEWEVVTDTNTMDIIVPPGEVLSQFWECWSGGGCVRRCDGQRELLSDSPCMCPADYDQRREQAASGKACKPTTRLNVMLRDLPDIGTWRLESHGFYAAVELAGTAQLLELATKAGHMIPAVLRLDPREKRVPGQATMKWVVPAIEIAASFGQVSESLGLTMGAPAALPSPSSQVALPPVSKGRQRPSAALPAPPPLPDAAPAFQVAEPSTAPAAPKPALGALRDEQRAHKLLIAATNSGCADMLDELVGYVSDGAVSDPDGLSGAQMSALYDLLYRVKQKKVSFAYDENGQLRVVDK